MKRVTANYQDFKSIVKKLEEIPEHFDTLRMSKSMAAKILDLLIDMERHLPNFFDGEYED